MLSTTRGGPLISVAVLVAAIVLWQITSSYGWINPLYFPSPSTIFAAAKSAGVQGDVLRNVGYTLERAAMAYLIAGAAGISLGLLMGYFGLLNSALEPLIEIIRPIPAPALLPLFILILGIGDPMKITVAAIAAFFPILLNTIAGVRDVSGALRETSRLLNFSHFEELRTIVGPGCLPNIMTGLRISLSITLLVSVVTEMIATGDTGLGFFILNREQAFQIPAMYVGVVVLGIIGFVLNKIFVYFEQRTLVRWAGRVVE